MRLLNVETFTFSTFEKPTIPRYAVASHRWDAETEATMKDVEKERNTKSQGYLKARGFCTFVQKHLEGIDWLWIDTCCIDRKSAMEVGESINSMFDWYRNTAVCLAFMKDVTRGSPHEDLMTQFRHSEWFARGWTLQELIAPQLVVFIDSEWEVIGHKGSTEAIENPVTDLGPSLVEELVNITRIPEGILTHKETFDQYSVKDRLKWLDGRRTTKPEDRAYCMLGIFDVYLSLIYGEGEERALGRLLEERKKTEKRKKASDDDVLLLEAVEETMEPDGTCQYFLEGKDLSPHVVRKYIGSITEASVEVVPAPHKGRDGFLIKGKLPNREQLAELRQQSREHERAKKMERHFIEG